MTIDDEGKAREIAKKDIFEDKENLLVIWEGLRNNQRHQIEFILNNAKFFFTLITALFTVYFGVALVKKELLTPQLQWGFIIVVSVLVEIG